MACWKPETDRKAQTRQSTGLSMFLSLFIFCYTFEHLKRNNCVPGRSDSLSVKRESTRENVVTLVYRKMSIFWARVKGGANPIMRRLSPASQNILTHNRKNRIEIGSNLKKLHNFEFIVLIGG